MTNNKIDTEIKLRYPATDPHNTLESIGFRNGATWAFEEVKLALAEKEKEIENLKFVLGVADNLVTEKDLRIKQLEDFRNDEAKIHSELIEELKEEDKERKRLQERIKALEEGLNDILGTADIFDIINKIEELLKPKP